MARAFFKSIVRDTVGNVIQNAKVFVYETGTTSAVSDLYLGSSGGTVQAHLISNEQGEVAGYLSRPRYVKLRTTSNAGTAYYPTAPAVPIDFALFDEDPFPVYGSPGDLFDVTAYGATGDGTTDDAAAIQATIDAAPEGSVILLPDPSTAYLVASTLTVTKRGLSFRGTAKFRGSQIRFTGTGELFKLGTDSGNPHDTAEYDGVAANTTFEFLNIAYTGATTTALTNGQGNYGTGTYAIRDWRGGECNLRSVYIEKFEYGFWGIQSDINTWTDVQLAFNKVGAYLGPRSDQFTAIGLYTTYNDRAVDIDRATNARFIASQFVDDGATTINPIRIRSAWVAPSDSVIFDKCWFEHLNVAGTYEAWVEIGVGDSVTSTNVVFNDPWIGTDIAPSWHTDYFVKVGRGDKVTINNPHGKYITNVSDLVKFVGTTSPQILVRTHGTVAAALGTVNAGSGTPEVYQETWATNGRIAYSATNGISFNSVVATLVTSGDVVVGGNADTSPTLSVNGAAGNAREIAMQTGGVPRWVLRTTNDAEAGSNAGSNFHLLSRADDGTALLSVMTAVRSTGLVTFGAAVTVTGTLTTAAISGAAITGTSLTASQGAATTTATINATAGQNRELRFQSGGSLRWVLRVDNGAEAGSNAGSDMSLLARDDSGNAIGEALRFNRSSMQATFGGTVSTAASTTTRAGLRVPHGTAPTTPTNGDIWTDTSGMYVRINGVTMTVTLT